MGIFYPFRNDAHVKLIGVEAAGLGIATGKHSASISAGSVGVLHGNKTYLLQDSAGQIREAHSVAAGLDYPGVGPEHSYFKKTGRADYVSVEDGEALEAFRTLCTSEGIIPAMESAHAIAYAMKLAPTLARDQVIVINLSGRGDKDAGIIEENKI
jgi:tryptophan synthase beta chain